MSIRSARGLAALLVAAGLGTTLPHLLLAQDLSDGDLAALEARARRLLSRLQQAGTGSADPDLAALEARAQRLLDSLSGASESDLAALERRATQLLKRLQGGSGGSGGAPSVGASALGGGPGAGESIPPPPPVPPPPGVSTNVPASRGPTHHIGDEIPRPRPRSGFAQVDFGDLGPLAAGESPLEQTFGSDSRTRWEASKATLQELFTSYVNGDLAGFMGAFSSNMEQDLAIFRNAVQEDFQRDTSINVDIQAVEYRVSFGSLCTRFLWNRNSVDQKTGTVSVQTGETYTCFDRHDGFRIQLMTGSVPFGRHDPQFQTQVKAGQPNDPLGVAPTPSASPSPSPSPPPSDGPFTITLNLNSTGAPGNVVAIDLDTATRRQFFEANSSAPFAVPANAGEDVAVYIPQFGSGTPVYYQGLNGATVVDCSDQTPTTSNVRNVDGFTSQATSSESATFGVQTPSGLRALVVLSGISSLDFIRSPDGNPILSGGTVDCTSFGAG